MRALIVLFGSIAMMSFGLPAGAGEGDPKPLSPVDFKRDIEPIFKSSCFKCHGPSKPKAQLRLDVKSLASKGGLSGPPLVPGKPDESLRIWGLPSLRE